MKLFQMSKIQNLKAIHNPVAIELKIAIVVSDVKDTKFESNSQPYLGTQVLGYVVSDVKDTKFESNSQLIHCLIFSLGCCFRCQRYKIWKQFTTTFSPLLSDEVLFQMSKIQNLKAIHNITFVVWAVLPLFQMSKIQNLKAIHNTIVRSSCPCVLFQMSKIQNLKAIHNLK